MAHQPPRKPCEQSTIDGAGRGGAVWGVYDLVANTGWVSVGMSHDTAAFAVQVIRRWWTEIGSTRYPEATQLQRNPMDLA